MKGAHWGTITLAMMLIAGGGVQRDARALDPEPTVDEQFQDQAGGAPPSELPPPTEQEGISVEQRQSSGGPAYLGVTFDPSFRNAAVVRDVHPGSPAELAGLQPGDVIEQVNGRPVRTNQDVISDVARLRAGDVLNISFSRRITAQTQAALDSRPGQNVQQALVPSERAVGSTGGPQRVRANRPTYDNSAAQQRRPGDAQMQRRGDENRNDRQRNRERGSRFRGFGRR
jgi:membrane-associated protease RseP (regulator of RpoE activity)